MSETTHQSTSRRTFLKDTGRLAATSKRYAFLFLLTVFFVIPAIGLVLTELLTSSAPAP